MLNVQVTYDAEVNDKALTMDALKNIAYIGYNHDPYDTQSYKEKTTEKLVYTYGIKVLKVGESGTDILKNAEFTLWPLGKSSVIGAGDRSRTYNLLITSQLLCH